MATSFQPQDPHHDAKSPRSSGFIIGTAVLAALVVAMIAAFVFPRFIAEDGANWIITLVAALVAFFGVLLYGFRRSGETTVRSGDQRP